MKIISFIVICCLFVATLAQEPDSLKISIDTTLSSDLANDTVEINFEQNLDSTMKLFYATEALEEIKEEKNNFPTNIPDSVYIQRLMSIKTVVPLSYNKIVRNYIEMYTQKRRRQVEVMLGLSEHYFPIFDEVFDYYDIPNEMKYMSIVESALNPRAYSRARAVGLWQFMYGTGKVYGLEINSVVDERRDPIKSTHAAASFVKDMYNLYGDWILVIAAYNCGPGNVNKAIRRAGGKKDYWEVYRYLPRETRGHIPAFIAATYTMKFYDEHKLVPASVNMPSYADTVHIKEKLHFEQVSSVLNIPVQQIRDLNPQFRYDVIPADKKKTYALRLPEDATLSFIDYQDSIFNYKDSVYFSPKAVKKPNYSYNVPSSPGKDYVKLSYIVKSGDNLGFIASWYNVRVSDLKYWNNINRNMIRSGQRLYIYKHKSKASKYKDINDLSFSQKQARIGKTVSSNTTTVKNVSPLKEGEYTLYEIKSGDSLWEIAKKYPGVSDTDIMQWNNISNPGNIKPGQKLKIKKVN